MKYQVEHPETMGLINRDQYLSEKKLVEGFIDDNKLIFSCSFITFLSISIFWYTERKKNKKD